MNYIVICTGSPHNEYGISLCPLWRTMTMFSKHELFFHWTCLYSNTNQSLQSHSMSKKLEAQNLDKISQLSKQVSLHLDLVWQRYKMPKLKELEVTFHWTSLSSKTNQSLDSFSMSIKFEPQKIDKILQLSKQVS